MSDGKTYYNTIPPHDILTEAIFELMREIGVKFENHPKAFDLFADVGCDVSRRRGFHGSRFGHILVHTCRFVANDIKK